MMIGATLFVATQALADSVTVNGQTYSCTTRCVVTTTSHGYSVSDCCGGRVHTAVPGN
jgi:hypothetical protein